MRLPGSPAKFLCCFIISELILNCSRPQVLIRKVYDGYYGDGEEFLRRQHDNILLFMIPCLLTCDRNRHCAESLDQFNILRCLR
jgi:hypothetical protein